MIRVVSLEKKNYIAIRVSDPILFDVDPDPWVQLFEKWIRILGGSDSRLAHQKAVMKTLWEGDRLIQTWVLLSISSISLFLPLTNLLHLEVFEGLYQRRSL